jgi:hypothetical protein
MQKTAMKNLLGYLVLFVFVVFMASTVAQGIIDWQANKKAHAIEACEGFLAILNDLGLVHGTCVSRSVIEALDAEAERERLDCLQPDPIWKKMIDEEPELKRLDDEACKDWRESAPAR